MEGKKEKDRKESALDLFVALRNADVPLRCPICNRILNEEQDLLIPEDPPRAYHMDCYKKAFPTEYEKELDDHRQIIRDCLMLTEEEAANISLEDEKKE
jgi:hypothetical protein